MDLASISFISCKAEKDTQKKFNEFFSKLSQKPWVIHDSSTQNYFKDPIAKIDLVILDGPNPLWPQLVSAIELKFNIGDKRDTSGKKTPKHPPNEHHEAIGQLMDRFTKIFEQQPTRQEIIGAVASDSQIEFWWGNREFEYKRSGLLSLDLTDVNSMGLTLLLRLVTAPKAISHLTSRRMKLKKILQTSSLNHSFGEHVEDSLPFVEWITSWP